MLMEYSETTGAIIAFSIFIASNIRIVSPFDTLSPTFTDTSITAPCIGDSTSTPPLDTGVFTTVLFSVGLGEFVIISPSFFVTLSTSTS